MATVTYLLCAFVSTHGLLDLWNQTRLPDSVWRSALIAKQKHVNRLYATLPGGRTWSRTRFPVNRNKTSR
jgi:hypothetical protein